MILLAQGIHASVYSLLLEELSPQDDLTDEALLSAEKESKPGCIAVKLVYDDAAVMPPHDVRKEIRLLRRIDHANIIPLLRYRHDSIKNQHLLYLPQYAITLNNLIDNPYFSPYIPQRTIDSTLPLPPFDPLSAPLPADSTLSRSEAFDLIASRTSYQLLSAVTYLHGLEKPVSHRDVKPSNIMLDWKGDVKLIDFGIAVEDGREVPKADGSGPMRCTTLQVGAGAYRAPELIFGAESYSPFAVDIWALGVTLASLFTPLRYGSTATSKVIDIDTIEADPCDGPLAGYGEANPDEGSDDSDADGLVGVVTLGGRGRRLGRKVWRRQCLFEGGMGDLGLAWSNFRVKGTPTEQSWPDFTDLSDSSKISFFPAHGIALSRALPFLQRDPSGDGALTDGGRRTLRVLEGMLEYSASRRWSAGDCMKSEWLSGLGKETEKEKQTRRSMMEGFLRGC